MAEKSRAERYRELHPGPLTPEWKKNKTEAVVSDLIDLMDEMPDEEKAKILQRLREGKKKIN